MSGFWKWVGIAAGVVVGGFVLLMIIGSMMPQETADQQMARIKSACEAEYGVGTEQASRCQLRIVVEKVERNEQEKQARAERAAR